MATIHPNNDGAIRDRGLETVFPAGALPDSLFGFVARFSGWHQLVLSVISVAAFFLETVPLELQRRIVNDAFKGGSFRAILTLALIYAALALAQGLLKLLMNIYRSYVGEKAVRSLRLTVHALGRRAPSERPPAEAVGVETSMMLAEAEPIGAFVGAYLSEPLLQGGILVSIFGYMVYLQPAMALVALLVFAPQLVFVPLMQAAINRRVTTRIGTLRDVSGGMVGAVADGGEAVADAGDTTAEGRQRERIDHVFRLDMGIFKLKFSMNFLMNILHHLGIAGVLAVGGWFVVNGETEVGTVVAFLSGLARLNDPWGDLVTWFRDLTVTGAKYRMIATAVRRFGGETPAFTPADRTAPGRAR